MAPFVDRKLEIELSEGLYWMDAALGRDQGCFYPTSIEIPNLFPTL
jgi:hypothetical protein